MSMERWYNAYEGADGRLSYSIGHTSKLAAMQDGPHPGSRVVYRLHVRPKPAWRVGLTPVEGMVVCLSAKGDRLAVLTPVNWHPVAGGLVSGRVEKNGYVDVTVIYLGGGWREFHPDFNTRQLTEDCLIQVSVSFQAIL